MNFISLKLARKNSNNQQVRHFFMKQIHQWKRFIRWQDLEYNKKKLQSEQHLVRNTIKLNQDFYISPERIEQGIVRKFF